MKCKFVVYVNYKYYYNVCATASRCSRPKLSPVCTVGFVGKHRRHEHRLRLRGRTHEYRRLFEDPIKASSRSRKSHDFRQSTVFAKYEKNNVYIVSYIMCVRFFAFITSHELFRCRLRVAAIKFQFHQHCSPRSV